MTAHREYNPSDVSSPYSDNSATLGVGFVAILLTMVIWFLLGA